MSCIGSYAKEKKTHKMSKENFLKSMQALLGADYARFESALDKPAFRGVYVNTLKCKIDRFRQLFPFALTQTPFSPNGFYIAPDTQGLGTHPLHHAGAFYAQEPSAMSAAAAVDAKPGEKILDLCAAPGGKTTALAGALAGKGLLWSNEYVKQRAFTLLSNCERIGVQNAVISGTDSASLAAALPAFFDKVLVDAPCSGEGMLRREKAEYARWNEKNIAICAARQKEILAHAAKTVKVGGYLIYSTCTFNKAENEDVITYFLKEHADFSLVSIEDSFGSPAFGMPEAKRVFPSDGGEGHFVAKLQKHGEAENVKYNFFTSTPAPQACLDFLHAHFQGDLFDIPCTIGEKIYLIPPLMPQTKHINILRAGILAGEMKGARFVPAHALFAAAGATACRNRISLSADDSRLAKYLHGEEIDTQGFNVNSGYCAVQFEGIPLGFGKVSNAKLKNHYPKGLRNLS